MLVVKHVGHYRKYYDQIVVGQGFRFSNSKIQTSVLRDVAPHVTEVM